MDSHQFDRLTKALTGQSSRRSVIGGLFGGMLGLGVHSATAKRTKVVVCHKDQTIEVAESAVKAHLKHGDTVGPCTTDPACTASYQISGFPFETSGEICDVRDSVTGEPAGNAICRCGCPGNVANCSSVNGPTGAEIVTASCCPTSEGACISGGTDTGIVGAVCCKPSLTYLVCNQQFRYAVGFSGQIDCVSGGQQRQVDCTSDATVEDCNERCRAVFGDVS